jgi:hypothetical protein
MPFTGIAPSENGTPLAGTLTSLNPPTKTPLERGQVLQPSIEVPRIQLTPFFLLFKKGKKTRPDTFYFHEEYLTLGKSAEQRQQAYRSLFNEQLNQTTIDEIRQATNKAWVLGSSHFKDKIEKQLNRRVSPAAKGGDRKSEKYQQIKINRV